MTWEEDRAHIEAHPEDVDLPQDQIAEGHVSVFEQDGRALGFVVVLPRNDGVAQLDALYVEPDAQGRGIGRWLTQHALDVAREHGAVGVNLIANLNARGFYEKCGFHVLVEVPTPWGRGVRMAKSL